MPESISKNSHVTTFMTPSIDRICQEVSSIKLPTVIMSGNLYVVSVSE